MKNRLFKSIIAVAVLATSAAALAGCGQKTEDSAQAGLQKITVCLEWTPNTNHTGLYVAKEMGFFEEAGLDVTIVQPPENGSALMCATGQAQFAVDNQDIMAAYLDQESPLAVTAVAAILQHNTSGIISRAGEGITSPKGLEGKTYSTWESPIELATMKFCMEKDNADFEKLNLIPNIITDEPAALAANQTDAIWVFYGWSGINAEIEGVDCDFFYFKDIDVAMDYYTPVIIANNDFLANEPDTARAFLAAAMKGYEYAIENPKAAADMLMSGDNTGSLAGAQELVYKSQEYISTMYKDDSNKVGYIDAERWNAFYSWLYENGLTTNDLTGIGFTNDYLPE